MFPFTENSMLSIVRFVLSVIPKALARGQDPALSEGQSLHPYNITAFVPDSVFGILNLLGILFQHPQSKLEAHTVDRCVPGHILASF